MADTTHAQPVPFCVVDAAGQVLVRGMTLELPQVDGCTTLAEQPPADSYRTADGWSPIPAAPSALHTWDWSTHAWIDPTLEQLRAAKLAEINAAFREASGALIAGYPTEERQTWAAQEADALAWAADPAAATPYLDGIAAARGIDAADMRVKTLEAVNTFRVCSQWLVGTRQALRDAIQQPHATRAQIEAIAWPTAAPGDSNA